MATIGLASAVFTNAPTLRQPYDNIILNEAKLSQTQHTLSHHVIQPQNEHGAKFPTAKPG
jgi:hypothetical protein